MNIVIKSSTIKFKNPQIGQPTRAVPEHYFGRNVVADVNGDEQIFRLLPEEVPFEASEDDFIAAIQTKLGNDETSTK